MTLSKDFSFTIKTLDFNKVAKDSLLISTFRALTLHSHSGMNYELNHLLSRAKTDILDVRILAAYHNKQIIAWALLSKEESSYSFANHWDGYKPSFGTLFEVFVDPNFRRKGIGTALLKAARKKINYKKLCLCPWDSISNQFYGQFDIKYLKM